MTDAAPPAPASGPVDWDARFRAGDAPWERAGLHPAVPFWLDAGEARQGWSVLVPGCGRGAEPLAFAKAGLAVTALDLAPSAIAFQRQVFERNGLEAAFVEGDALAWRPSEPADLVYEQTFLCAISPKLRGLYEQTVHAWLKPGGRLLALFMQKAEWGGPPYACPAPEMRTLFSPDRWDWPSTEPVRFDHERQPALHELGVVLTRR
jgi:SAM-dependent methyltransferase